MLVHSLVVLSRKSLCIKMLVNIFSVFIRKGFFQPRKLTGKFPSDLTGGCGSDITFWISVDGRKKNKGFELTHPFKHYGKKIQSRGQPLLAVVQIDNQVICRSRFCNFLKKCLRITV